MIFSVWWICFRCWSLIFFFTWNDKFLVAVRILIQAPHRFQYFPTDQSSTLCQQAYLFSENDKLKGMNQDLQPPRDFSFICPLLVKWGGGGLQYSLLRLSRLLSWWFVKLISFSNIYAMNIFTSITWF